MSYKNRTNEFSAAVNSMQNRRNASHVVAESNGSRNREQSVGLLGKPALSGSRLEGNPPGSRFSVMARQIALGIHGASAKLEQLGKLARRKTLFDDRPQEISELTSSIKQDITQMNMKIRELQQEQQLNAGALKNGPAGQEEQHSENVVVGLQNRLAKASQNFAQVLEIRTENLKAQKERRDQFSLGASTGVPLENRESALYSFARVQQQRETEQQQDHVSIDMQMSQVEIEQQSVYIEQRSAAVESIEQTIGELAQIFQQLGTLVAQQRDQVMRIDDNVLDIESNVDMAKRELMKYWTNVSSNRMLMVKVFAVVLFFFFVFTLIL